MHIFERIEQRVALPGDSKTRRAQKVLGTALMFAGSVFTTVNVASYMANGLTTVGYLYAAWAIILLCAGLLMLALYVLGVLLAAWFEPYAQADAPQLPLNTRMQIAASNLIIMGLLITAGSLYLLRQVENYRRRADDLLLNILPGSIAARLKESQDTIADGYSEVTVLFADIVDFTSMSTQIQVTAAVKEKLEGQYKFVEREPINIKGKGMMVTYLLAPA